MYQIKIKTTKIYKYMYSVWKDLASGSNTTSQLRRSSQKKRVDFSQSQLFLFKNLCSTTLARIFLADFPPKCVTVDFNQSFVGENRLELLGSPQGRGMSKIEDFDAIAKIVVNTQSIAKILAF